MKIGIISINAHTKVLNFASPLHTYAFQQFLLKNGIESTIIDYKPVYYGKFDVRHPLFYYIDHPDSDAEKQKLQLERWKTFFYEREYRFDRIEEFINKYYIKTDKCYTAKIMEKEDPGFDCYLCVTDVIWKYNPVNGFDRGFLLACEQMKGKKKIAYAASRGAKGYTREQGAQFFDYIRDFDHISVRENSLKEYIDFNTDLDIPHVLDPVFLMDADFYYDLAIPPKERGYVLIYIVMEKADSLVEKAVAFAQAHNLDVIELSERQEHANMPEGTSHPVIYGLGVEEWLGYMQHAEYIFTNSFHACCFSIIFHKQFFAGARSGDKIDSVLEMFDLSWRRIKGTEVNALDLEDIAFEKTEELLQSLIKSSSDYILNAIHDAENHPHTPLLDDSIVDKYWEKNPPVNPIRVFLSKCKRKLLSFFK